MGSNMLPVWHNGYSVPNFMAVTNNCCDIFQKNLDNLLVLPEKTLRRWPKTSLYSGHECLPKHYLKYIQGGHYIARSPNMVKFENHKRALVTLNYIWCLWLMPNRCLKSCAFWSMFIKNKLVFCPKNDPVVWFKKRKWLKLKVCINSKRLKWSSARTWSLIQTLKELRK